MANDTHVHNPGNGGDGGRGVLYALLAVVVVLIIVGLILFVPRETTDGTRDIDADIRIETPDFRPDPGDGGTGQGGGGQGGGGDQPAGGDN
jgi:hypothetical protein